MKFGYDLEDNVMTFDAYKVTIKIFFDSAGVADFVQINEHEFDVNDDTLIGLKVDESLTHNVYRVSDVVRAASDDYEAVREETLAELQDYDNGAFDFNTSRGLK